MYLLDEIIECESRKDRVELFPIYDTHVGKRNCAEGHIVSQRREILKRADMPNRHVRVVMGGDICDVIKPQDVRFDVNEVADWVLEGDATSTREKLNDIAKAQVIHAAKIFAPLQPFILGNIEANHDKTVRKRYNTDTHRDFCEALNIPSLTDEAKIRFRFRRPNGAGSTMKLYLRHGYGGGRTPGAEPAKIERMMSDGVTHDCDVCLTGHTHTFCNPSPTPVLYIPNCGRMPARQLTRYRFGVNPGCWLYSHLVGPGSYESAACYPSRALMTVKIVVWPFWSVVVGGQNTDAVKIEVREYPIL